MARRKKVVNHTKIPDYKIEAIARCILPDILAYYESEEGQQEFARWQQEQKTQVAAGLICPLKTEYSGDTYYGR